MHLTIKFLGNNVSPATTDWLIEELKQFSHNLHKIEITTSNVTFGFPSQSVAKTLYLGTEENEQLLDLVDKVDSIVKRVGSADIIKKKERKKFTSHITVARVKHDISRSQVKSIRELIDTYPFKPETFYAKDLYLIKSDLTKKGPIYSIFTKIPLDQK